MKMKNRLTYTTLEKNCDKKWWEFWKNSLTPVKFCLRMDKETGYIIQEKLATKNYVK